MSSKSYERKKKRRLEIKKTLPENLRDRVALRNVMAVARLTSEQHQALADALDIGLKRVPTALRHLKTNPDVSAQELFRASLNTMSRGGKEPGSKGAVPPPSGTPAPQLPSTPTSTHPKALEELLSLLKTCYPEMNPYSARALAESEALSDILSVLTVYQQVFDSPHFNTDFVVVLFHNLLEQTREQLNQRIADNPAYQQALRQCSGQALRQAGIDLSVGQGSVDQ